MIVPVLLSHETRYRHEAEHRGHSRRHDTRHLNPCQPIDDLENAEAYPDGESVERTGVGIVALARLKRVLIEIEHDGETRHEEEQHHDPEIPLMPPGVEEEACQAQQEREHEIGVVALVVLQAVGHERLVAEHPVVDDGNARNPVAMRKLAVALDVVLTAAEIPKEIAQVHEVDLI